MEKADLVNHSDLIKCAHCGSPACYYQEISGEDDESPIYTVECRDVKELGCTAGMSWYGTPEKAREAWNRRYTK